LLNLPFVAVGEEFLKLLIFISFYLLLSQFSGLTRVFLAIFLASFIFGHMHIFGYILTAGVPIMIGAIPTFYFILYYRSILPLILEHFFFDFYSFSLRTEFQVLFQIGSVCLILIWVSGNSLLKEF
jgi:hypothetical protein